MTKKQTVALVAGIIVVVAVAAVGHYYYKKYRGALPAISKPTEDIAKNIPSTPGEAVNNTNLPLKVPPGFIVSLYAKNLQGPRVLILDPAGNMLVSLTDAGKVVVLKDTDHNGSSDQTITVLSGLNKPHGLVTRCENNICKLYVAETNKITVYDYDAQNSKASNAKKIADLPGDGRHYTRTLLDNDGTLLVSVGSSCDVCNEPDSRRAAILQMNYDGSNQKVFASGLRNSVFMIKSFIDGSILATEMGRDNLGDNIPPDEINIIQQRGPSAASGQELSNDQKIPDFGWPICYGKNIHDDQFDKNKYIQDPCTNKEPSFVDLQAHSAPLGIGQIPEEGWPEEYWYNLIVAYHGSWNRSVPTGYKLVRIKLNSKGEYQGTEDFITGFLPEGAKAALGRPAGVLVQPGGIIYVSDDKAGVVYRIAYHTGSETSTSTQKSIKLNNVKESDTIKSPLTITGSAPGPWFFEASFPVVLVDSEHKEITRTTAQAQGEWMSKNEVPFTATLNFKTTAKSGWIVFKKDNPSDLPENNASYEFPVTF